MTENHPLDPRFLELASRFLDGAASPEELEALNEMTKNDPRTLDALGELLNQHGTLAWMQRGRASFRGVDALKERSTGGQASGPAPRRIWWIAVPLAACLLVTAGIIRFAPVGSLRVPKPDPPLVVPALKPEFQTLSFQDGTFPTGDYRGTRDTQLIDREPSVPRGSQPQLEVEGESGGRPSLLKFDLRAIPPGSRVISATLDLTITAVSRERQCEAYMVSRPWVESQATWIEFSAGRRWEVSGARGSQDRGMQLLARFSPVRGVVSVPLTDAGIAAVQRWINSDGANHGLLLQTTDRASEFTFHSREAGTASLRPKFTVNFLPAVK